ncbi:hypothetical protein E2I00_003909 [Balaenoptera physalus]|uniref:Large ribosomal subunit protein mL42 n=1 Tax=Balaenoptera physalus TaxID=9770 RepID=A0A6A1Q9A7_BALPH|nr:hypothetical protein E2I00_003909 [Balaenoptera physalus]
MRRSGPGEWETSTTSLDTSTYHSSLTPSEVGGLQATPDFRASFLAGQTETWVWAVGGGDSAGRAGALRAQDPQDDYNCKVELALTSDGRTIVCYHPSVDIAYEHTKLIPRADPVQNNEETHDLVLKTRLEEKGEHLEQGPMIEQLSKMFFTTKHRWYPRGQYHRRRRKLNPPKDR